MKPLIIIENVRSAYNVGNIIRTADALGYDVVLSWFSPSPADNESVKKTSLGAEATVNLQQFRHSQEAVVWAKEQWYTLVAAEVVAGRSIPLDKIPPTPPLSKGGRLAIIVGNEKTGVLEETLEQADYIVHIPMQGEKQSLNVGQAAAIVMWELQKVLC
jgi:tRNA G18 (ribose-2'-O)-methylase SpoU